MQTMLHPAGPGLDPADLSRLVNRRVLSEHAGEAAFLWTQRERAVDAPQFRLTHLRRLDERVQAHLAALRVAGEPGWRASLERADPDDAGAIFTICSLAFDGTLAERMRHALALVMASPHGTQALAGALGWLRPAVAHGIVARLLQSTAPDHRRLGGAALAALHAPGATLLQAALGDPDPGVRAPALRAVGACGAVQFTDAARQSMQDADPACAFWAAWSLAVFGDEPASVRSFDHGLRAPEDSPLQRLAVEVALRRARPEWARQSIRDLTAAAGTRRLAIIAAAAHGDPVVVPWLIAQCGDPALARIAGEAISMITGADLVYLDLQQDEDETAEAATPVPTSDAALPRPDPSRLEAWWRESQPAFERGRRHLGGEPVSAASAARVLRSGFQRQRAAAALELCVLAGPAGLFPTRARADRQGRWLAA